MIEIDIPGGRNLGIEHLVFDYNGTLAKDGILDQAVPSRFDKLSEIVQIHVVTADTFGVARANLENVPCKLTILPVGNQVEAKRAYVESLGSDAVAAFGNGRNDEAMLDACAVGVVLIRGEGAATRTLLAADIVCTRIDTALDLFLNPKRLVATLRT